MPKELIYDGRIVKLWKDRVTLPNGYEMDMEIIRHPGASAILPVLSRDEVILIRQYRHAAGGYIYEVPAGKLDSPGEAPALCARREMQEESGYDSEEINYLSSIYTTPGFTDEVIHLYYATNLKPVPQKLDHDEILNVMKIPFPEALQMIYRREIIDAKSIITIMLAWEKLK